MVNGFYTIYYTGVSGQGFGILVLKDGIIVGADAAGGFYDGQYITNHDSGTLDGTIRVTIPRGVGLVTGVAASSEPHVFDMPVSLPQDLGVEKLLQVQTPSGPVNVNVKKIREFPD